VTQSTNFVIIIADDLGWGDVGCFGADDIETPNLDRIAADGAQLRQWYGGSPVCSASRASLMTGRFCWRAGVPGNVPADWDASGLSRQTPTLAELLRDRGYATAMSGKWHLGQAEGERPHDRGFDDWFGFLHGCIDYYSHTFYWLMAGAKLPPRHDLYDNGVEVHANGRYFTDLIAERAVSQIAAAARNHKPFFLYLPFNAPHYPMQAPPEAMARFAHLPTDRQATAALIWEYDKAIGRVLDALDAHGLGETTCVLATGDHGPSREDRNWPDGRTDELYRGGSTGGLRGAKFSVFEGGVRVPTVMRWPGVVEPGSIIETPMGHVDLVPTLLQHVTGGVPAELDVDGVDVKAALTGEASELDRPRGLCWTLGRQRAVRDGRWKLVENGRDLDPRDGEGEPGLRLYDLRDDPGEKNDRSAEHPDMIDALRRKLADASSE